MEMRKQRFCSAGDLSKGSQQLSCEQGPKCEEVGDASGLLATQDSLNSWWGGGVTKGSHEDPSGDLSMLGNKWAPGAWA